MQQRHTFNDIIISHDSAKYSNFCYEVHVTSKQLRLLFNLNFVTCMEDLFDLHRQNVTSNQEKLMIFQQIESAAYCCQVAKSIQFYSDYTENTACHA